MFELGTHKTQALAQQQERVVRRHARASTGAATTPRTCDVRLETIASVRRQAGERGLPPVRPRPDVAAALRAAQGQDRRRLRQRWRSPRRRWPRYHSLDAKFTTTDHGQGAEDAGPCSARRWAGPGSRPTTEQQRFPEIRPLVSNDWTVLHADAPPGGRRIRSPRSTCRRGSPRRRRPRPAATEPRARPPAWHGTLLPADRRRHLAGRRRSPTTRGSSPWRSRSRPGRRTAGSRPRTGSGSTWPCSAHLSLPRGRRAAAAGRTSRWPRPAPTSRSDEWYDIAAGKGVLVLAELREVLGDGRFRRSWMSSAAPTPASRSRPPRSSGRPRRPTARPWNRSRRPGSTAKPSPSSAPDVRARKASGRFWAVNSFERQLDSHADRLRDAGRGRRPARGRRHAPAQGSPPAGPTSACRSRPIATSATTT